jgi:hypothetical protein
MRRTYKFLLAGTAILVSNLGTASVIAQTSVLHLVIATDDLADNVGPFVKQDKENVCKEFQLQVPRDRRNIVLVKPKAMDSERIIRVIRRPNGKDIGPNDALVFFYSGHGGFDQSRGHYLWLSQVKKALVREDLREEIKRSPARLRVILTSCCSSVRNLAHDEVGSVGAPFGLTPLMDSLFFSYSGFVDLTAAKPGEFAFILPTQEGGGTIFGQAVVDCLSDNKDRRLSWEEFRSSVAQVSQHSFQRVYGQFHHQNGFVQTTQTLTTFDLEVRPVSGGTAGVRPSIERPNY